MSDRPPLEAFLKWELRIESPSLACAAKAATRNVILAVDIPYPLLKAWYDFIANQRKEKGKNEGNNTDRGEGSSSSFRNDDQKVREFTYTDLFENSIPQNCFAIREDQHTRAEVEESLRIIASKVHVLYGKTKGGSQRKELNSKSRIFHIFEEQILSIQDLKREDEFMKDEIAEWKRSYANLQEESKKLYQEMLLAMHEREKEISTLQQQNRELLDYIECLEKNESLQNKGKDISEVKNKSRSLKTFLTHAQTALWFSNSFGLSIQGIQVKEQKTGQTHHLELEKNTGSSLSDEDKTKIEQVLFLLDKFCVGDSFYHELTMTVNGLSKSYPVKQRRDQLNEICHVDPTPGSAEGAQMSFTGLLRARAQDLISRDKKTNWKQHPIQVKISGDGARMTRNSSFILISFSLLHVHVPAGDDVMSASGNHTVATVKGSESYNTLKEALGSVFSEINDTIKKGHIVANESKYHVEFFLGGDYKLFLLIMMGMKGATSIYSCLWCKIAKDCRWKMDLTLEYYNTLHYFIP